MGNEESQYQSKEDLLKAIDLTLTGLLQMANPKDLYVITETLINALVELNPNLIVDKKEN